MGEAEGDGSADAAGCAGHDGHAVSTLVAPSGWRGGDGAAVARRRNAPDRGPRQGRKREAMKNGKFTNGSHDAEKGPV
jgi:hypothetical protein